MRGCYGGRENRAACGGWKAELDWSRPVFPAFAMHVIGELSAVFILFQIAFVIVLIWTCVRIGGYRLLTEAFVPIAFLLFAIPLPYFVDAELTVRLQLLSSQLGAFLSDRSAFRFISTAILSTWKIISCRSSRPAADCVTSTRSSA